MHKKLATDLTSLAHSILQMKNKEDVLALKQKAYEIYEKLTVLAFVDEYINTTPNAEQTKEEILEKIEAVSVNITEGGNKEGESKGINEVKKVPEVNEGIVEEAEMPEMEVEFVYENAEDSVVINFESEDEENSFEDEIIDEPILKVVEEILEQPFDELEQTLFSSENNVEETKGEDDKKIMTLEDELEDTISVDIAADLFEKPSEKKSLNDTLQVNIQIGLNDRIAFVKNLFEGNQGDFNRVVSQLNTLKTEKEARKFINKMVKPDYNWTDKEEYEERFMSIIERKFA